MWACAEQRSLLLSRRDSDLFLIRSVSKLSAKKEQIHTTLTVGPRALLRLSPQHQQGMQAPGSLEANCADWVSLRNDHGIPRPPLSERTREEEASDGTRMSRLRSQGPPAQHLLWTLRLCCNAETRRTTLQPHCSALSYQPVSPPGQVLGF